jgi:hypothetical protein
MCSAVIDFARGTAGFVPLGSIFFTVASGFLMCREQHGHYGTEDIRQDNRDNNLEEGCRIHKTPS